MIGNDDLSIILVLAIGAAVAYQYGKHRIEAQGPLDRDKIVNIPKGLGSARDRRPPGRENVIEQPIVSSAACGAQGQGRAEIRASTNSPSRSRCARTIDVIVEGKVIQHAFTIPEGLTSEQIVARLAEVDSSPAIREIPKEGTLLPETYNFRAHDREQAIRGCADASRALQEIWNARTEVRSRRRKRW